MATHSFKVEVRLTLWWWVVIALCKLRALWPLKRLAKRRIVLFGLYVNGTPASEPVLLNDAFAAIRGQGVGGIESSGPIAPPTAAPAGKIGVTSEKGRGGYGIPT